MEHLDLIIDILIEKASTHRELAREYKHHDAIYSSRMTAALIVSDLADVAIKVRLAEAQKAKGTASK